MGAFQGSASIQFGPMMAIPISYKKAVSTDSVSFSMIHAGCDSEEPDAGYTQKWYCKGCTDDITRADTVKAWKGEDGRYRVVDTEYLKGLEMAKNPVINLDGLVPADQIDPRYYIESYDVTPADGSAKGYKLLTTILTRSGKVAIGKVIMQGRERIVTIRPRDGVLAMELMYWPADLTRAGRDAKAREAVASVELTDAEVALGDKLAEMMASDFDPTQYRDEHNERLRAYLAALEAGDVPQPIVAAPAPAVVDDLTKALEASLAAMTLNKKATKKDKELAAA